MLDVIVAFLGVFTKEQFQSNVLEISENGLLVD